MIGGQLPVVRLRAVLFDFDGTLAPSLSLWIRAFHLALAHYDIAIPDDEVLRRCFFRDWDAIAADFAVGSGAQFQSRVDAGLQAAFAEAVLFPQALAVVEHCRLHHLQTALVTSSPRKLVIDVIGRLGLRELFDCVICGDDVRNYKPHPEPVLAALAALERGAAEAIMIGDSHVDILAGKAAGTRTALFMPDAHGGFHDRERLLATQPDHIFADHLELPALLGLPRLEVADIARAAEA